MNVMEMISKRKSWIIYGTHALAAATLLEAFKDRPEIQGIKITWIATAGLIISAFLQGKKTNSAKPLRRIEQPIQEPPYQPQQRPILRPRLPVRTRYDARKAYDLQQQNLELDEELRVKTIRERYPAPNLAEGIRKIEEIHRERQERRQKKNQPEPQAEEEPSVDEQFPR